MKFRDFLIGGAALTFCISVAASTLAQEQAERRIERHAAVGEMVRLAGHVNYRPCNTVIPTTITVIHAPAHGALTIRDETVTSADPELGRVAKCKGSSGMGRVVYYTRTSPGFDSFRYNSVSANGVVHFDVTVD